MKPISIVTIVSAFILSACAGDADDTDTGLQTRIDCDGVSEDSMRVVVTAGSGEQPVDQDVKFRGTASHDHQLTIRQVVVAGVIASNDAFNHSNWSATVPVDTLLTNAIGDDPPTVTVPIEAKDACGNTRSLEVETILVASDGTNP